MPNAECRMTAFSIDAREFAGIDERQFGGIDKRKYVKPP